jgi:hypothetical protein
MIVQCTLLRGEFVARTGPDARHWCQAGYPLSPPNSTRSHMTKPRIAVRWLAGLAVAGAFATGVAAPAQATTHTVIPNTGHHHIRPLDTNWNGT